MDYNHIENLISRLALYSGALFDEYQKGHADLIRISRDVRHIKDTLEELTLTCQEDQPWQLEFVTPKEFNLWQSEGGEYEGRFTNASKYKLSIPANAKDSFVLREIQRTIHSNDSMFVDDFISGVAMTGDGMAEWSSKYFRMSPLF